MAGTKKKITRGVSTRCLYFPYFSNENESLIIPLKQNSNEYLFIIALLLMVNMKKKTVNVM
jgi:hypothetical protein